MKIYLKEGGCIDIKFWSFFKLAIIYQTIVAVAIYIALIIGVNIFYLLK